MLELGGRLDSNTSKVLEDKVMEILGQGKFHSLPVLNGRKIVGMVTTTDLIRYLAELF